jgi:hypothetical protein
VYWEGGWKEKKKEKRKKGVGNGKKGRKNEGTK